MKFPSSDFLSALSPSLPLSLSLRASPMEMLEVSSAWLFKNRRFFLFLLSFLFFSFS